MGFLKRVFILTLVGIAGGLCPGWSQDGYSVLAMNGIDVQNYADRVELKRIIRDIEEKYKINFAYQAGLLDNKFITISENQSMSLGEILYFYLSQNSLDYQKVGEKNYVIYKKKPKYGMNTPVSRLESRNLGVLGRELEVSSPPISGTITNKTGEPLIGVNVLVKGTNKGTATDFDGRFELEDVDENAVLVLSYIGYQTQEVPLNGQSTIQVELISDAQLLDELVVVGYGTMKKSDLTGSVSQVDAKLFQNQSMTQLTDMLTGTVAGMNVNQSTSARGGGSLQIRGPKSLNASTAPMVVLDGAIFNGSVNDINPADIEKIDILKDASSAAIFGARSAAGVILITTKRGSNGKPTINFSGSTGLSESGNEVQPFNAQGYLDFRRDVLSEQHPNNPDYYFYNPANLPGGVSLEEWRSANNNSQADDSLEWLSRLGFYDTEIDNYTAGKTVDWYRKTVNQGLRQDYNLSIGGGLGGSNYYWSIGYTNNEGIIAGDQFNTVRSKLNLDFEITDWLDVGMNAQFASSDESGIPASLTAMFRMSPYGSEYNNDGSLKWYPNDYIVANPFLNSYLQDKLVKVHSIFIPLFAKVKLPLGIEYKLSYQPRYQFRKDYNFWPSTTITGGSSHSKGYGTRNESSNFGWILDNLITWNKKVGYHSFDLTLLYSAESNKSYTSMVSNETFVPNENLSFSGLQYGTNLALIINDQQVTGDAAMGRLNYTLLDKYLFTTSIRRDGYSAFGKETPRAIFPAFAFAWKISDEGFFKADWINQLKLRLSWGVNGNRDIGVYSALAEVRSNLYFDGTNTQIGVINSSLANYSLVWEKTQSMNFGFDIALFENRMVINADYYDITTNDLLMNRLLPDLTGFNNITTNLGELGNQGFELTLNTFNINNAKFSWNTNLAFSLNRNKIKRLFGDFEEIVIDGQTISQEVPDYTNGWFPGQAIDRVWDYNITGIWQVDEADAASVHRLSPGDFKAVDVDGNGVYEALDDKQFIGYRAPRLRLGLRNDFTFLKHFSASLFIRADLGHIGAYPEALNQGTNTYDKRNRQAIPYWTPGNESNDHARLLTNITSFGGGLMIYRPLSFVRIQDFSCSYNLPEELAQRIKLNNLRIYGSVRNLYSFDNWPGWDPESENSPMPRTYSIGISFSL